MTDFADLLRAALKEAGLTQVAFAERIERSQGYVSQVLKGISGPSDHLEPWADALGLKGAKREAFLEAGYLLQSPEYVQKLVADLRKRAARRSKRA